MTVAATALQGMGLGRHVLTGRGQIFIQPRASAVFEPGSAVVHRAGVQLAEVPLSATPRTDLVTLGTFVGQSTYTAPATADSAGGAVDANGNAICITVTPISSAGTCGFATAASGANQILATNTDQPCFWYDDDTLYLTDAGGTLSFAGWIGGVDSANGRVVLRNDEILRCLYELYSPGQSPAPGALATQDDTVRFVATSLPAATFAAGVLTLTATGAFSTAQDGVTPAVGDKFVLPAGIITTLVVSAANSGVYEVTSLGATGVSAVFTRSAKWAHGAIITPETVIRVGGEGTVFKGSRWTADPATASKVVGTDDPILYPEKVTQQIVLVAGHIAAGIINVPIKSATKSNFVFSRVTANTCTLTTGGYQPLSITAGGIGAATVDPTATIAAGTINVADVSTLNFTILN